MSENIISGLVTGTVAPIILSIIFYCYKKVCEKIKPKFRNLTKGCSIDFLFIEGPCLNIDIENITNNHFHIKNLNIIIKKKYIVEIPIKNCYLNNSKKFYTKDYYTLKPSELLQIKISFTGFIKFNDIVDKTDGDSASFTSKVEDIKITINNSVGVIKFIVNKLKPILLLICKCKIMFYKENNKTYNKYDYKDYKDNLETIFNTSPVSPEKLEEAKNKNIEMLKVLKESKQIQSNIIYRNGYKKLDIYSKVIKTKEADLCLNENVKYILQDKKNNEFYLLHNLDDNYATLARENYPEYDLYKFKLNNINFRYPHPCDINDNFRIYQILEENNATYK